MADDEKQESAAEKLNPRQKLFCEIYARCINASKAAREAGYSGDANTLGVTGHDNLKNPKIRAYVDELLAEQTLSPSETIKGIADIAKGDLKEYFTVRQILHRPKVSMPLSEFVERRKEEVDTAQYALDMGRQEELFDADELQAAMKDLRKMKRDLLNLEIRLTKEPEAMVIVDGEPELIETAELDIARLVQDEKAGKIKSVKTTDAGTQVELYPADAALRDLAKYHGLFEKHNNQRATQINFGLDAEKEEYVD